MTTAQSSESKQNSKNQQHWNFEPGLPIQISPLFIWPINIKNVFHWFWSSWLLISEKLIILGVAVISWYYFHPLLERCTEIELGWVSQIFIRNLVLMVLVAGGLHLYFYTFRKQHDDYRYDDRPLAKNRPKFTFKNQVHDNIFWTCCSGVPIWTAYEVLLMWALANGYAPLLNFVEHPVWFIMLFLCVPLWESFYFYLIHRFLHWSPLYRIAHSLHHRNTNVGPWSGLSMHPLEHVLYLGTALIHFIVAAHPLHVIFHLQYFTLTAATTHTGYAGLFVKDKNRLALGTFHHQMHHRYFECNYGGLEIPWDKWLGSFHDGSRESHQHFQQRRIAALKARR